jgi:hypothetical protein
MQDLAHHPKTVESSKEHARAKHRAAQLAHGQETAVLQCGQQQEHAKTTTTTLKHATSKPRASEHKPSLVGMTASAIRLAAINWLTKRIKRNRAQ